MNMKTIKEHDGKDFQPIGEDFFERLWQESWIYIKTVVDVVREPVLILDHDLKVMAANESFYRMFQVEAKDTENKVVYELGNGQWNIPALKKLLENILPQNTFFKGFEVSHDFPTIGHKIMILNARQIHTQEKSASKLFPPIILLAIEDVTDMMIVADALASHANQVESDFAAKTNKLGIHISKLEMEINELKKRVL